MASKETKRERRELAKKTRMEAQRRAARARRLRKIYGGAITAGAVVLIVALILWNNSRSAGATKELNELAVAAGCTTLQSPSSTGEPQHVTTDVQYPTNPPTSGDHAGNWWAIDDPSNTAELGGPQTTTIQEERLVHNLEHGQVVLHYRPDVPAEVVTALNDVATSDPAWFLSQPNPELANPVAFAAWGKMITCDGTGSADQVRAAATRFADLHKNQGPERNIPMKAS